MEILTMEPIWLLSATWVSGPKKHVIKQIRLLVTAGLAPISVSLPYIEYLQQIAHPIRSGREEMDTIKREVF